MNAPDVTLSEQKEEEEQFIDSTIIGQPVKGGGYISKKLRKIP